MRALVGDRGDEAIVSVAWLPLVSEREMPEGWKRPTYAEIDAGAQPSLEQVSEIFREKRRRLDA
jgi:hypothetical protein